MKYILNKSNGTQETNKPIPNLIIDDQLKTNESLFLAIGMQFYCFSSKLSHSSRKNDHN